MSLWVSVVLSVRWDTGLTPASWSCLSCSGLVFPHSPFPGWRSGPTLVLRPSLDESARCSLSQTGIAGWGSGASTLPPPAFFPSSHSIRKEHVHSCPRAVPCYKLTPSLHFPICESLAHTPSRHHPHISPPGRYGSHPSSSPGACYQGSGHASSGPVLVRGCMWDSHHLSLSFCLLPELLC